jgi:hypothetical protein
MSAFSFNATLTIMFGRATRSCQDWAACSPAELLEQSRIVHDTASVKTSITPKGLYCQGGMAVSALVCVSGAQLSVVGGTPAGLLQHTLVAIAAMPWEPCVPVATTVVAVVVGGRMV